MGALASAPVAVSNTQVISSRCSDDDADAEHVGIVGQISAAMSMELDEPATADPGSWGLRPSRRVTCTSDAALPTAPAEKLPSCSCSLAERQASSMLPQPAPLPAEGTWRRAT